MELSTKWGWSQKVFSLGFTIIRSRKMDRTLEEVLLYFDLLHEARDDSELEDV